MTLKKAGPTRRAAWSSRTATWWSGEGRPGCATTEWCRSKRHSTCRPVG